MGIYALETVMIINTDGEDVTIDAQILELQLAYAHFFGFLFVMNLQTYLAAFRLALLLSLFHDFDYPSFEVSTRELCDFERTMVFDSDSDELTAKFVLERLFAKLITRINLDEFQLQLLVRRKRSSSFFSIGQQVDRLVC